MVDECKKIVRTAPRLYTACIDDGTSKPSSVVRDNTVSSRRKGGQLVLPNLAAARCGMYEDNRDAAAACISVPDADAR